MTTHSEGSITQLLRARYKSPEWAFLAQVKNRTGYGGKERYLDGLAMGLYPSRGLVVHGFEIKVSRSDWMHELKHPDKAEHTACYCDHFWAVTPKDLIRPGELPAMWGWLSVDGEKIKVEVPAPSLTSKPLDRTFIASVLRNLDEQLVPVRELNDRVEARYVQFKKEREERDNSAIQHLKETLTKKEELILKFQRETGLLLDDWRLRDLAPAIRAVMDGRSVGSMLERKKELMADHKRQAEVLEREIAGLAKAKEILNKTTVEPSL